MKVARPGSRGGEIRFLQIVLNTHLQHRPKLKTDQPLFKLKVDGIFGNKTERMVRDYQKFAGLKIDGIVGPQTWKSLLERAEPPRPNLKKFRTQLGTVSDFIQHVRRLEANHPNPQALFTSLSDFFHTSNGVRYLLTKKDPKVIDFRHFFAAASETLSGSLSRKAGLPIGASRGEALLLGVINEMSQCIDEGMKFKMNSCFSREDLGSNRLGAEFGRIIKIAQSEASTVPMHQQLQSFLGRVAPQPPKTITSIQLPGVGNIAKESLAAIVVGIVDLLFPEAY